MIMRHDPSAQTVISVPPNYHHNIGSDLAQSAHHNQRQPLLNVSQLLAADHENSLQRMLYLVNELVGHEIVARFGPILTASNQFMVGGPRMSGAMCIFLQSD